MGGATGRKRKRRPYIPSVNMRSSQQLSSVTDTLHVCPVLSAADADVAVVIIERARGESTGGASVACMMATVV